MKNASSGPINRLDIDKGGKNSELEDKSIKITKLKQKNKKDFKNPRIFKSCMTV